MTYLHEACPTCGVVVYWITEHREDIIMESQQPPVRSAFVGNLMQPCGHFIEPEWTYVRYTADDTPEFHVFKGVHRDFDDVYPDQYGYAFVQQYGRTGYVRRPSR